MGTLCRTRLSKKKLPLNSADYYEVDYIKPDSNTPVMIDHEPVKKGTAVFSFDRYKKEEAAKRREESEKKRKEEEQKYQDSKKINTDRTETDDKDN